MFRDGADGPSVLSAGAAESVADIERTGARRCSPPALAGMPLRMVPARDALRLAAIPVASRRRWRDATGSRRRSI
ncbi:hypothetical protein HMPREF0043_01232 [Actinobaculum sp. oral taxon 183 str. F0552]|nr:hypothetical protein HMPREF0043_01232 [Actinobaculum sp. oral taxon 183 str. F0552]